MTTHAPAPSSTRCFALSLPSLSLLSLLLSILLSLSVATAAAAQDPAAERLLSEAQRLEQSGQSDAALAELQLLIQQFPRDRLAPQALLRIARLQHLHGDAAASAEALEKVLADYPRTLEAASAFLLQAEHMVAAADGTADLEAARVIFRRVPLLYGIDSFPELEQRARARVRSGELSLLLGDAEQAAAELLPAVEDEPPGPWTGRARLALATALLRGGDWQAAVEILERIKTANAADSEAGAVPAAVVATDDDRAAAGRLLDYVDRHVVRPQAGGSRWASSRQLPVTPLALREPSGIAAAEDGRVVLVDGRGGVAALLDADGRVVQTSPVQDAERPGWSADGTAYVVTETQVVLPFDGPRTSFLEPRNQKEAPLKGMRAAERGVFEHWFVLAKGWKGLLAYDTPRRGQELLVANRPDFEDLASDAQGRIYLLDQRANTVSRLGLDRRSEGVVVTGQWRKPVALAVDRLGQIYVLDRGNRSVEVYDARGQRLTAVGPGLGSGIELRDPVDVAVDGAGRLFIADEKLPFAVVLE